jgi:hypothetical protein
MHRKTFMQTVKTAIRRMLSPAIRANEPSPYPIKPHAAKLATGIDNERMNSLADELDDAARLGRL